MTDDSGRIFSTDSLIADLRKQGGYFVDFLKIRHLEAGLIVLKPGEKDTQTPHDSDELYYVIRGAGSMELGKKVQNVEEGSIVFVPAKMKHRFFGNADELVVLYFFAEE